MRATFSYAARTDTRITGSSTTDCLQPLYGSNNQLTAIIVDVFNGTTWQTLRRYNLGQGIATFTRGNRGSGDPRATRQYHAALWY